MQFFRYKYRLHPLAAFVASLFLIVFGLVFARDIRCTYYLAAVYAWLFAFGCYKGCLKILPAAIIFGGGFALIVYFAYGRSFAAAYAMGNRFAAVFLAVAIGMCVEPVALTRSLSQIHTPRGVTLGMLIASSFVPVLKSEIRRVREAMKTRGAGSFLNPKIFYRAFLVPLCMRLVGISDTLSLSVETRGFALGKTRYTVYKREVFAIWDVLFWAGLAVGAALAVIL